MSPHFGDDVKHVVVVLRAADNDDQDEDGDETKLARTALLKQYKVHEEIVEQVYKQIKNIFVL